MLAGLLIAALGAASLPGAAYGAPGKSPASWTAGWAASPVVGSDVPWMPDCPAGQGVTARTARNMVFVSAGGDRVRVRLSNAFGTGPLRVGHAGVAVQGDGAAPVPGSLRGLRFHGKPSVTIPAGAERFSDPVGLRVRALSKLLISVYLPGPTGPLTNHPFTAQGSYIADGDRTSATAGTGWDDLPCWLVADGVDVRASGRVAGSVVALGDSITDTAATTGNADHRWPDFLARRLAARPGRTLSVVNAGLGGNRLLEPRDDGAYWGVPVLQRLDRDVFAQSRVRTVILLIGINDIGFDATAGDLIAGQREVAARAHAHGLRIIGATLTPFAGSFIWTAGRQRTADTLNSWIRHGGAFDGVVDFAAATADPADPQRLDPAYDSGDHLHPNDAGTRAMATAVRLDDLLPRRAAP